VARAWHEGTCTRRVRKNVHRSGLQGIQQDYTKRNGHSTSGPLSLSLPCHLDWIEGDSSNARAGYERVRDPWTRQKREDLGFDHALAGIYKEIAIERSCSLVRVAERVMKIEGSKVIDLLYPAAIVQNDLPNGSVFRGINRDGQDICEDGIVVSTVAHML
jgi:hypothetical protein